MKMKLSALIVAFAVCFSAPAFAETMWNTMTVSAYGMKAQSERTRIIAENIANSNTAALTPEGMPYQRKIITFENRKDRDKGIDLVKVKDIDTDPRGEKFVLKYMPDHPGANEAGYVKMPNVNTIIETNDMREAQRTYEANLGMMEQTRNMATRTIDMLR